MRLGIGSYTYPWAVGLDGLPPTRPLTPWDLLRRARALGVGVVQYADNLPLHALSDRELAALVREAGDIRIEIGTRGIAPDNLFRNLEIARRVGSGLLRVVIDTPSHQPEAGQIVAALGAFLPRLEESRVSLAIENHDRLPASALTAIIRRIDHPRVGICLDTVNSLGCLETPETVVRELAPYTINLHVKDFEIRRAPGALGFLVEGRPAGRGRLDIPRLLATLREHRRDPNAILELWTPPAADLDATKEVEASWAAQSVAYLRTLIPE